MDVLAYPLTFVAGRLPVVDDGGDAGVTQQLRILVGTRRGERPLVPAFGIADPTFRSGIDAVDVQAGIELFGPEGVRVAVEATNEQASQTARLSWSRDIEAVAVDPGAGR